MAIISCPNCGESISDKALNCVHCGFQLKDDNDIYCSECGTKLSINDIICPNCGCPNEFSNTPDESIPPQKVEVTKVNLKPSIGKKAFVIILILVILGGGAYYGYTKLEAQKAKEEAARLSQEYEANLIEISYLMLEGAADAENCGNTIKSVWSNAIWKEKDAETDKYTRNNNGSGSFYEDFNDALGNLFADDSFQDKLESISNNQQEVTSLMRKMNNPPDEWKDAYNELKVFYDEYINLTNLAINPTGSLQSYSTDFNEADTNSINAFSKLKLYIE